VKVLDKDKRTVERILDEFILPYQDRIALSTERQTKFFAHKKVDACPIFIEPDRKIVEIVNKAFPSKIKEEDIEQEFFRILLSALRVAVETLMVNNDRVIRLYPAFGCSSGLTSLGMKQKRTHGNYGAYGPPDALNQEEALKLTIDDVQIRGDIKKRLDFIKYARAMVNDQIPILNSYAGGPFPFACDVMGTDFMMLTATDPKLAHEFLEFCMEATKKMLMWHRDAAGADDCKNTVLGGGSVAKGSRVMQMDIDQAVMFSPEAIDEFIIPSTCEFAKRCNIKIQTLHYCGWYEYFSRAIAKEKSIGTLNNNPVPGKLHDAPFEEVMKLCAETNTTYLGYWPKFINEHSKDYLKRLNKWAKEGVLFPEIRPTSDFGYFASSAQVADYWYQL